MPPKKAAKKHAPRAEGKHGHGKDIRRAYEHLGRVDLLRRALPVDLSEVATLVGIARESLRGGSAKDAAELLRASEHLSFAALAEDTAKGGDLPAALIAEVNEHFQHLKEKAEEHWDQGEHGAQVAGIYKSALKRAEQSLHTGAYHRALELVRAAEALAHTRNPGKVEKRSPKQLGRTNDGLRLAAS